MHLSTKNQLERSKTQNIYIYPHSATIPIERYNPYIENMMNRIGQLFLRVGVSDITLSEYKSTLREVLG